MKAFLSLLATVPLVTIFTLLNPTTANAQHSNLVLKIERYTSVASEVDIRPYIKNIENYKGLRLAAIEVVASALSETASTTVHVKDAQQGQALDLGQEILNYLVLVETDSLLGDGAEEIKLRTPRPAYIKTVNLIFNQ